MAEQTAVQTTGKTAGKPAAPRTVQWGRRLTQAASLMVIGEFSYYGIFRCPFAVPYVSCANCPVTQCPGRNLWLAAWALILGSAVLFGRAFCGYACPAGLFSEFLAPVARLRGRIGKRLDAVLSWGKYLAAAAAVYLFAFAHNPRWAVPIRTGEFVQATALTFEHAFAPWLWRTGFVSGALALGILVPFFWCRYLCPTGGVLELFARFAPARWRMTTACTDCGRCGRACDLETRPARRNCTNCGGCAASCPSGAVRFGLPRADDLR